MKKYTWEELAESHDFEHGQEFVKAEEVVALETRIAEKDAAIELTNKTLLNARAEYRKELAEWEAIGDEYSKLIDHCTRGLLSKANLPAKTVISVMGERRIEPDIEVLEGRIKSLRVAITQANATPLIGKLALSILRGAMSLDDRASEADSEIKP